MVHANWGARQSLSNIQRGYDLLGFSRHYRARHLFLSMRRVILASHITEDPIATCKWKVRSSYKVTKLETFPIRSFDAYASYSVSQVELVHADVWSASIRLDLTDNCLRTNAIRLQLMITSNRVVLDSRLIREPH